MKNKNVDPHGLTVITSPMGFSLLMWHDVVLERSSSRAELLERRREIERAARESEARARVERPEWF